jgi:hypothetical protein
MDDNAEGFLRMTGGEDSEMCIINKTPCWQMILLSWFGLYTENISEGKASAYFSIFMSLYSNLLR